VKARERKRERERERESRKKKKKNGTKREGRGSANNIEYTPPPVAPLSFPATARRAQLLGEQAQQLSLPLSLSLSSISLCLRSATHPKPLPNLQPPSPPSFVCLGLPRELPVFRSVASRQYIFQVLMAAAHARSHPYCEKHSGSLALSSVSSFSPHGLFYPASRPSLTRGVFHSFPTDIAVEEDLGPRPCRGDITSVKYS